MNGSGQSRPGRRTPLHCFSSLASLDQSPLSPSSRLHLGISTSNFSIGETVKRLRPYLSVLCVLPPPTQLDFEIKAKCNVNYLNFGLFSFIICIADDGFIDLEPTLVRLFFSSAGKWRMIRYGVSNLSSV